MRCTYIHVLQAACCFRSYRLFCIRPAQNFIQKHKTKNSVCPPPNVVYITYMYATCLPAYHINHQYVLQQHSTRPKNRSSSSSTNYYKARSITMPASTSSSCSVRPPTETHSEMPRREKKRQKNNKNLLA